MTAHPRHVVPRPQVLFICGNHNHTTMMHAIAQQLPDCDRWFTPYYSDDGGALDILRRLGLLEFVALGHDFRGKCLRHLETHGLALDLGGTRGRYDLVVTCSDLIVPSNIVGQPLVGVQEGMIDPALFLAKVMRAMPWLRLPRWAAGTVCTGLSGVYDRYCVASEGYRQDFIDRGAPASRLRVTGLPNFDDFARHVQPGHWLEGSVLACTSDGRETLRRDNRKQFIQWARAIAAGRPLVFKFHPNERMPRAVAEVKRLGARRALASTEGSGEEMIANCDVLVTQWSTLAYVGPRAGQGGPTYSYRDLDPCATRPCCRCRTARAARNIAAVCREVIAERRPGRERSACRSRVTRRLP